MRCAIPLADACAPWVCGRCLRRAPHFHAAYTPFRYGYPIDRLIYGLKYRREAVCGRVLGAALARRLMARPAASLPQLIIPMPLSNRRYRERGFNQAAELARPLHAALGVPIRAELVVRQRDTPQQTGLKQQERRRNVRDAFAMSKALPAQHVAILDDVITTGSTANELAKVLRRAGATRIEVWAIARAGR